jgi:NADPH:quinone reductase
LPQVGQIAQLREFRFPRMSRSLLFKNIRIDFLGSDDFAPADKEEAARATNEALLSGWRGMPIVEQFALDEIATAHEVGEASRQRGRVVVML